MNANLPESDMGGLVLEMPLAMETFVIERGLAFTGLAALVALPASSLDIDKKRFILETLGRGRKGILYTVFEGRPGLASASSLLFNSPQKMLKARPSQPASMILMMAVCNLGNLVSTLSSSQCCSSFHFGISGNISHLLHNCSHNTFVLSTNSTGYTTFVSIISI